MNNKNMIAVINYAIEQATMSDIPILDYYSYDTMTADKRKQQIVDLKDMLEAAKQGDNDDKIEYQTTTCSIDRTIVKFIDNGTPMYITVERGMIYIDMPPDKMFELINDEDYEPTATYDTSDGIDYFSDTRYADLIITALLQTANFYL